MREVLVHCCYRSAYRYACELRLNNEFRCRNLQSDLPFYLYKNVYRTEVLDIRVCAHRKHFSIRNKAGDFEIKKAQMQ